MKKSLKILGYIIGSTIIVIIAFIGIRFAPELRTLSSLRPVEGTDLYTMEYFSDYKFNEFLSVGAHSNIEYYEYVNSLTSEIFPIELNADSLSDACSVFTFRDSGGRKFMARNFDNKPNPVMLLFTSPDNAFKSISTVNLNTLGFNNENTPHPLDMELFGAPYFPTDGLNEKGISVSVLQVNFSRKAKDNTKSTIGVYAAVRLILDYADSVDKAVELLDNYNIYFDSSFMAHLFVADNKGNSEIIEFVDGKTHVIENFVPYQIASNFNIVEEQLNDDGYVHQNEYNQWLRNPNGKSAYDSEFGTYIRYDFMLDSLYNSSGILSQGDAFKLLENVASPSKLQYSVIYNNTDLLATVITDNDWEHKTTVGIRHTSGNQ